MKARYIARPIGFLSARRIIIVYTVFPFYYAILSSMRPARRCFTSSFWPAIRRSTIMSPCSASSPSRGTS